MMKVLNLYAGIGGNRKLWEDVQVTSVELDPSIAEAYQNYFPDDEVIVGDAHQYLLDHHEEFDFIWTSPPCTTHTRMNVNFGFKRYADMSLYQEIIFLNTFFKGKFCVENVIPYYGQEGLLIPNIKVQRHHRHLFWCNFRIQTTGKENPPKQIAPIKAQKSKKLREKMKPFIKEDDDVFFAEKFGFEPLKKKLYIKGNHSPAQVFRNCVDPKIGLMVLNHARNIIIKSNTKQQTLF